MKKEEIYLSDSFETFLSFLYGKQKYHQDAGLKTISEWKERIDKIINSIEYSIINTIEISDKKHKDYLLIICQDTRELISKSLDLNDLNEKTILGLFKLIFYLIGDRPDHWDYIKVNKSKHWMLNSHRQIMYYQSNEHKVNLIINNAPSVNHLNDGKYNKKTLIDKLHHDLNSDYGKFLDWYKNEYRDKYYELY